MNKYGLLIGNGIEGNIKWEIYKDNNFLYTIIVSKKDNKLVKDYQGINAIFGNDVIDIDNVNKILDEMIEEIK